MNRLTERYESDSDDVSWLDDDGSKQVESEGRGGSSSSCVVVGDGSGETTGDSEREDGSWFGARRGEGEVGGGVGGGGSDVEAFESLGSRGGEVGGWEVGGGIRIEGGVDVFVDPLGLVVLGMDDGLRGGRVRRGSVDGGEGGRGVERGRGGGAGDRSADGRDERNLSLRDDHSSPDHSLVVDLSLLVLNLELLCLLPHHHQPILLHLRRNLVVPLGNQPLRYSRPETLHHVSSSQPIRSDDVTPSSMRSLPCPRTKQGDVGRTVGVVLDSNDVLGTSFHSHVVDVTMTTFLSSSDTSNDKSTGSMISSSFLSDGGGEREEGSTGEEPGRVGHFEMTDTLRRSENGNEPSQLE